jgi:hypothetical protein
MGDPNRTYQVPLFASSDLSGPTQAALANRGNPSTLNLDDIFGDVVFTPDGDTVFLSEGSRNDLMNSGEGNLPRGVASRPNNSGGYDPVAQGGGLYTTQLMDVNKPALTMGAASAGVKPTAAVPFKHNPQRTNHLQYAAPKKKKTGSAVRSDRKMSEQQKVERR